MYQIEIQAVLKVATLRYCLLSYCLLKADLIFRLFPDHSYNSISTRIKKNDLIILISIVIIYTHVFINK